MKYFLYDTETGGNSPKYSLLTFFGVILDEKLEVIDNISLKIKNKKYVLSPEAMKINKIDFLKHDSEAEDLEVCVAKLSKFLLLHTNFGQEKLVNTGHNIFWDLNFVKIRLLPNIETFVTKHNLDTGTLALILKSIGKLPSNFEISLKNLANHYNVEAKIFHTAEDDVYTTVAVLKCMLKEIKGKEVFV